METMNGIEFLRSYRWASALAWLFLLPALLAGCLAVPVVPGAGSPATDTQAAPVLPSPTVLAQATAPQPTLPPVAPEPTQHQGTANIYLIALEDQGKSGSPVGCGDSLVAVPLPLQAGDDPLRAALVTLLSNHDRYYGSSGLFNALYQSNLQFESLTADASGEATVNLSGTYQLGGECDDPRFQAQLEGTVRQFPQYQSAKITINGKALDELLSGRGPLETIPPVLTLTPTGETVYQEGKIFLVIVDDQGKSGQPVGCGDSLVPASIQLTPTTDPAAAIKSVLENLFAAEDKYAGGAGFYNALKNSSLKVDSVSVENEGVTVQLSGVFQLSGECDNPRVEAQITSTASQFSGYTQVHIFLNGHPLHETLSLK